MAGRWASASPTAPHNPRQNEYLSREQEDIKMPRKPKHQQPGDQSKCLPHCKNRFCSIIPFDYESSHTTAPQPRLPSRRLSTIINVQGNSPHIDYRFVNLGISENPGLSGQDPYGKFGPLRLYRFELQDSSIPLRELTSCTSS